MTRRRRMSWGWFFTLVSLLAAAAVGVVMIFATTGAGAGRAYTGAAVGAVILVAGGFALTVFLARTCDGNQLARVQLAAYVTSGMVGGVAFAMIAGPGWPALGLGVCGGIVGAIVSKVGIA